MCEPTTIALVASAAIGTYSAYQTSNTQKKVAQNNAIQAEYAAKDAQRKGELEAQKVRRDAESRKSSQQVALAANGLDISYGTAGDLQDQIDFFAKTDAETARYNAALTANNYRTQAGNFRGAADAINPGLNAGATLLSSGAQVADRWYANNPSSYVNPSADGSGNSQGDRRKMGVY